MIEVLQTSRYMVETVTNLMVVIILMLLLALMVVVMVAVVLPQGGLGQNQDTEKKREGPKAPR